jgi:hypothetical protein
MCFKTLIEYLKAKLYFYYDTIEYAERKLHCKYRKGCICKDKLNLKPICSNEIEQTCPQNTDTKEYDFTHGRFRIKSICYWR